MFAEAVTLFLTLKHALSCCLCAHPYTCQGNCGGQKTPVWSRSSPSSSTQGRGLSSGHFALASHCTC